MISAYLYLSSLVLGYVAGAIIGSSFRQSDPWKFAEMLAGATAVMVVCLVNLAAWLGCIEP